MPKFVEYEHEEGFWPTPLTDKEVDDMYERLKADGNVYNEDNNIAEYIEDYED